MATFVLMTKLAPEVQRQMKDRQEMGKQFLATVSKKCPGVRWIAHYALLGPYDFMDIYEAPDIDTAHRVSLISRADFVSCRKLTVPTRSGPPLAGPITRTSGRPFR